MFALAAVVAAGTPQLELPGGLSWSVPLKIYLPIMELIRIETLWCNQVLGEKTYRKWNQREKKIEKKGEIGWEICVVYFIFIHDLSLNDCSTFTDLKVIVGTIQDNGAFSLSHWVTLTLDNSVIYEKHPMQTLVKKFRRKR